MLVTEVFVFCVLCDRHGGCVWFVCVCVNYTLYGSLCIVCMFVCVCVHVCVFLCVFVSSVYVSICRRCVFMYSEYVHSL